MYTNAQVAAIVATFEAKLDAIASAQAPAPAARPAKGKAKTPNGFVTFLQERASSKVACDIHSAKACNRTFTPASSGRENHVARIV